MPAYHMRMKDLDAIQAAERRLFMKKHHEERTALLQKHRRDRIALRQSHRDERARAKAEKALHDKSKVEPDFWTYFPNHEGRRDTMTAVLKALGQPTEQVTELMPTYAAWLLTANKTHENRPMNRWALMTAFVMGALRAPIPPAHEVAPPGEVERILKPESVIVQMLIESGDLMVENSGSRV